MRDTSFLKQSFIAHRGYHNTSKKIPENSILAFKKAIENNLIIELDVHLLKDGNVVVFHDDNLKRMTGLDKSIKDLSYKEICNLKLQNTNETIPLLKDVLDLVDGKVPIIIELKTDVKVGKLEKRVIDILKNYQGKYAIKSFRALSVWYFKKHSPDTIRGLLIGNKKKEGYKKYINKFINPDFLSCDIRTLSKMKRNELILGWTIRNNDDLIQARKYCDNCICENINLSK